MSDELNVIRSNRPEPAPSADALANQRSEFMQFLDQQPTPKRRRVATAALAIAGVTALGLPAAAAINNLTGGDAAATEFTCVLPQFVERTVDGQTETGFARSTEPVTGDPLVDCAAALSEAGIDLGEGAKAYRTETQYGIVVVPEGAEVEASIREALDGATPLEAGAATDPEAGAALRRALDYVEGDDCISGTEAQSALEASLAAEGLSDWSVSGDFDSIDGFFVCANTSPQPDHTRRQIELTPVLGGGPGSFTSEVFDGACVGPAEAESRLPSLVDDLDTEVDWNIVFYANDSGPIAVGEGWPDVDGSCVEVLANPDTAEIMVFGPQGEV